MSGAGLGRLDRSGWFQIPSCSCHVSRNPGLPALDTSEGSALCSAPYKLSKGFALPSGGGLWLLVYSRRDGASCGSVAPRFVVIAGVAVISAVNQADAPDRLPLGVDRDRCCARSSKPLWGYVVVLGGFDSHALPPVKKFSTGGFCVSVVRSMSGGRHELEFRCGAAQPSPVRRSDEGRR
jgi:hypothetical protein